MKLKLVNIPRKPVCQAMTRGVRALWRLGAVLACRSNASGHSVEQSAVKSTMAAG